MQILRLTKTSSSLIPVAKQLGWSRKSIQLLHCIPSKSQVGYQLAKGPPASTTVCIFWGGAILVSLLFNANDGSEIIGWAVYSAGRAGGGNSRGLLCIRDSIPHNLDELATCSLRTPNSNFFLSIYFDGGASLEPGKLGVRTAEFNEFDRIMRR
jgi:hypothetical protein